MINLIGSTINMKDINSLCDWLKTNPRLTKGPKTFEFEKKWSEYIGCKYSVFVNSGSSANLAMIYTLKLAGNLKNYKVVVPALCWATTISPIIQLGMKPIICDIDLKNLGPNLKQLERIFKEEAPAVFFVVNPLGFLPDMEKIQLLCKKYGVILIEDSCETVGSQFKGQQAGTFGLMSSFSFFFGHHLSTVEGGMISTNDEKIYEILKMERSHGWDRDLNPDFQKQIRKSLKIDDFNSWYTFYIPAFNIRSTDLQAKIGIDQIDKLDSIIWKRYKNYQLYQNLIKNNYWKVAPTLGYEYDIVSNFAYPVIHPRRKEITDALVKNHIECRPLISGNIAKHPAFDEFKTYSLKNADIVHKYGFYVPNHPHLSSKDIRKICKIINNFTGELPRLKSGWEK